MNWSNDHFQNSAAIHIILTPTPTPQLTNQQKNHKTHELAFKSCGLILVLLNLTSHLWQHPHTFKAFHLMNKQQQNCTLGRHSLAGDNWKHYFVSHVKQHIDENCENRFALVVITVIVQLLWSASNTFSLQFHMVIVILKYNSSITISIQVSLSNISIGYKIGRQR